MKADIVERLLSPAQAFYEYSADDGAQLREAAAHIEALTAQLARAREVAATLISQRGEPLANESARTHYWRDKALVAARALQEIDRD